MGLFGDIGRFFGGNRGIMPGDQPGLEDWLRAAQQGGMQQEPMATRKGGGLFGGAFDGAKWSDRLSTLADGLAAAGAYSSGDWQAGSSIAQNRAQLQGLRAKQIAEAQQQQQMLAALKAQGLTDEQAMLVMGNAGSLSDFRPDAPQPTNAEREASWYAGATPEQRAAYDQMHPIITNGFGSTVVPRNSWGQGNNQDATPTVEDGHQYTPGPGGRANPANWKELGGVSGSPAGVGFRPRR